ncbi:MAG TPA: sugar transferase [Candidatus Edwardsbacteria bacterium]|nr:sugar transferase [Candidatus Edwardsbacteria bacterium]
MTPVKLTRYHKGIFPALVITADCGLAFAAAHLAWTLVFGWLRTSPPLPAITTQLRWIAPLAYLAFMFFLGSSIQARTKVLSAQVISLFRAAIYTLLLIISAVFLFKGYLLSRSFILVYFLVAPLLLSVGRLLLYALNLALLKSGWGRKKAVIIGTGQAAREIFDHLLLNHVLEFEIIGFLVESPAQLGFRHGGVQAIGLHADLDQVIDRCGLSQVFIPGIATTLGDYSDTIETCQRHRIDLLMTSHQTDLLLRAAGIEAVTGVPLVDIRDEFWFAVSRAVKRAMDIVLATLGLLVIAPAFLLIMALIVIDSPGWPFYRQLRLGERERPFWLIKFRTMLRDADKMKQQLSQQNEADGPIFKIRNDPRITKVGRWLRRLSLDELPQLINVLKGEMSLVGPRPPLPAEVARYKEWQKKRLDGPQGMTGLWQISGRSELAFEEMVLLDIYYLEHWSPILDLEILFKTIPVVMLGKGAY